MLGLLLGGGGGAAEVGTSLETGTGSAGVTMAGTALEAGDIFKIFKASLMKAKNKQKPI